VFVLHCIVFIVLILSFLIRSCNVSVLYVISVFSLVLVCGLVGVYIFITLSISSVLLSISVLVLFRLVFDAFACFRPIVLLLPVYVFMKVHLHCRHGTKRKPQDWTRQDKTRLDKTDCKLLNHLLLTKKRHTR
jgi:hypothetical protein